MSSSAVPVKRSDLRRLLDLAFGFFVWMAHFLVVYVATALACVLGSVRALDAFLLAATGLAAAVVVWHALSRYRRIVEEFARTVTVGGDAIALVAILWQIFSVALVPACA